MYRGIYLEVYSYLILSNLKSVDLLRNFEFIIIIIRGGEKREKEKEKGKKKGKDGRLKKIEISKLSGIDFFVAFLNNFPPFMEGILVSSSRYSKGARIESVV